MPGPLEQLLSALDAQFTSSAESKKGGILRTVKDGVLEIEGGSRFALGEMVRIDTLGLDAMVLQVDQQGATAVLLEQSTEVRPGLAVVSTGKVMSVRAHEDVLGRVVDPLGRALDGKGPLSGKGTSMPLEAAVPSVMDREPVSEPLQTGILAIDALIPIGRGQRELIIGDRQTGKTSVAIDTILNQKGQDVICIYVAIGQRESKTAQLVRTLEEHGALSYTTIVSAGASSSALSQFFAPYAGVALAEYFMHKGKDVLVVYDDLSKHAVAYREVSLLLRKPPGREAYPGDVFYIHSRLLERAARLSPEKGGGSITALPIIETQAGDVSAYIPTNVISITDGQIFLESGLFHKGIRPAVNVGISVSRVGGAAQTKLIKKLSSTAKLDLAQYYELSAFSQFASDLDETSRKQLARGERLVEALKQKERMPRSLWQQATILRAVQQGALDSTETQNVVSTITRLLDHVAASAKDLCEALERDRELTDEHAARLDSVISGFFAR